MRNWGKCGLATLAVLVLGMVNVPLVDSAVKEATPQTQRISKTLKITATQKKQQTQQTAIKKIIKTDFKSVHGRWSVKVTQLSPTPLKVNLGNHKIGRQRSASTIKVFVMLTVYDRAQAHRLKLRAVDKQDLALMIHNSDNAATNRLIRRIGSFKVVNKTIKKYQFKHTSLQRFMLDTNALQRGKDNYTTTVDLTSFFTRAYRHQLLGKTYDQKMLQLLHGCQNHSKLPKLVKKAVVYNKTGEFPDKGVQNDTALFKTRHGVYTIVVMAQSGNQLSQYQAMNRLGKDVVSYLDKH